MDAEAGRAARTDGFLIKPAKCNFIENCHHGDKDDDCINSSHESAPFVEHCTRHIDQIWGQVLSGKPKGKPGGQCPTTTRVSRTPHLSGLSGSARATQQKAAPITPQGDLEGGFKLVGAAGFEPTTPCPPDKCATGLRYAPKNPQGKTPPKGAAL